MVKYFSVIVLSRDTNLRSKMPSSTPTEKIAVQEDCFVVQKISKIFFSSFG